MGYFLSLMGRHGYLLVFLVVFLEAVGFPVPAALALVAGGAAAAAGTLFTPRILLLAILGMLLGDCLLYFLGGQMGWHLLGFLCKLSANPESCILRSAESFYKRGRVTLLVAKFIPGVNSMAAPLAGSMKMPFMQFLGLDIAGASLYALVYGLIGYLFRNFLATIMNGFQEAGRVMETGVLIAVIVYAVYRISLYRKSRVYRIVPRVQVADLAKKLKAEGSAKLLLVDVRSHGYYDTGADRIQGSIRLEPNNLSEEVTKLPKDKDIYLYCT
jgi:membrane protein DedA with SNARE-associated domain